MNTSVSRDLSRNTRKKYNIRTKNRHGYFHNTHNFNVINRNSSLQPNSVGFSEYVLHNQNRRSHTRFSATRTNVGYLKHISSQSIRKEKEHSTIGCYEEYTLRKIRATSDMIKRQLMSPEHPIIASTNETKDKSDDVSSKLKKRQSRSVGGTSTISDNKKDNSSSKSIKKQKRLSEEVTRLQQWKERRKNELREKFKKDKIASQKSADIYNVKEISDKILQHISKMNNDRLVDFVNSDNSRYEEAFNYICKQKTFELTKALRDLSHQEKPEECEFVNSIIPEFSIKIEELPISVIRELSSTFDEMQRDIVYPQLSGDNLRLFNQNGEFQRSNDFSLCTKQTCGDNMNYGSNLNICSNEYQQSGAPINNAIGNKNLQFIEISDSDEENLPVKLEKENEGLLSGQQETDDKRIEQVSLKPVATGTNDDILCQEKNMGTINSNFDTQNFQSSSSVANVSVDIVSLPIEENSVGETNTLNSHPQDGYQATEKEAADSTFQEVEEKPYIEVELGEPSIQEKIEEKLSILVEPEEKPSVQLTLEEKPTNQVETKDLDSQPKIGSVWVSKSIFATSDSLEQKQHSNVDEMTNSHCENSNNSIPLENSKDITLLDEQVSQTSAENGNNSNEEENINLAQGRNNDISNTCNSEHTVLQSTAPKDNLLLDSISSVHDKLSYVTEVNDTPTQNVANRGETMINVEKPPERETCLNVPTADPQHEFVPSPPNNSTIPAAADVSPENEFISLTIKPFEKPKNLVDAVKMMKLIDEKIEVLTKLRQNIFVGLSESVAPSAEINPVIKKRKLDDSKVASKRGEISEKRKTPIEENPPEKGKTLIEENPPEKIKPFLSLNARNEVILFCRIIKEKDECIVGTDNGKIQYHSIYGKKPLMVVTIGRSAISFLEIVRIYDRDYVCTGTHTEYELKILMYKRQIVEKRIRLEDSILALANNWGYFFIGGKRGYLTRYDYKKNRIQYEDRISSSRIKDMKTTKEGPRRLLLIFFEDNDGVAHIDVRDAMTSLHIRTIIDMKNVGCMYLRHSFVYLATAERIHIYNGTNGDFVRSALTNKQFFSMQSRGNLLILAAMDGIYAFNMRNNHYLGCLQEQNSVSSIIFYEQKIVLTTWDNKIVVLDIPDHLKAVI